MGHPATGHDVQASIEAVVGRAVRPKTGPKPTLVSSWLLIPWAKTSLSTKFIIASLFVVFTTMLLNGAWIDSRMRQIVVQNAALTSTRLMENVIQGYLQEIALNGTLSAKTKIAINSLTGNIGTGQRILQIKIWLTDGTIAYTTNGTQIGERPPISPALAEALKGRVGINWNDLQKTESEEERRYGVPLFEVYAPMYEQGTSRIIAVAEFYEDATNLAQQLAAARQQNWLVVGLLTLGMLSLLFCIVHHGTVVIREQRQALEERIKEQATLLKVNEELSARVTRAGQESASNSDKVLRRLGADLHDGPAQLMSLALLRLHELIPIVSAGGKQTSCLSDGAEIVRNAMQEALAEIRSISTGVSLPHLERLSTADALMLAVGNHERRTKTQVATKIGSLPDPLPLALKTCLYRCVQEALNNAFRHAGAKGQTMRATAQPDCISLVIKDSGPGFDASAVTPGDNHLGLEGLRQRVELLGGTFTIDTQPSNGTRITVSIPYQRQE